MGTVETCLGKQAYFLWKPLLPGFLWNTVYIISNFLAFETLYFSALMQRGSIGAMLRAALTASSELPL